MTRVIGSCLLLLLAGSGCAMGGAANANAAHSTARGGDATNTVSLPITIALGDRVAEAAARIAGQVLGAPASLAGLSASELEQRKKEAVDKGVQEGLRVASEGGKKEPSAEEKAELEKAVTEAVDKAAAGAARP